VRIVRGRREANLERGGVESDGVVRRPEVDKVEFEPPVCNKAVEIRRAVWMLYDIDSDDEC
jgi:hypothetical protein